VGDFNNLVAGDCAGKFLYALSFWQGSEEESGMHVHLYLFVHLPFY